jgi:hypothetical protein
MIGRGRKLLTSWKIFMEIARFFALPLGINRCIAATNSIRNIALRLPLDAIFVATIYQTRAGVDERYALIFSMQLVVIMRCLRIVFASESMCSWFD